MSANSKYADSPHPKVLKSRSQGLVGGEGEVGGKAGGEAQGSSASLILPLVLTSSRKEPPTSLAKEDGEPVMVSIGGGEHLLGESNTDGDPSSPLAPSVAPTESTGGNAADSDGLAAADGGSHEEPLSAFSSPSPSSATLPTQQARFSSLQEDLERALAYEVGQVRTNSPPASAPAPAPAPAPASTSTSVSGSALTFASAPAYTPPQPSPFVAGHGESHDEMATPTPAPNLNLGSSAAVFSNLLFESHVGYTRGYASAPLPMPALSPIPLTATPATRENTSANAPPLSVASTTAVPSPATNADHDAMLAALKLRNPVRKASPLSRNHSSFDALSLAHATSDSSPISAMDQPVPDLLARLTGLAEAASNDVLRKAIAAVGPLQFDDFPVNPPPPPPQSGPQAQWDVTVMDSDGEVRLERRDTSAVVAQAPVTLRALVEPGDIVVNTPENFPDRFCVHPGNTLRLTYSSSSIESLLLRFVQGLDHDAETPPPTPPSARAADEEIFVLYFPALGHDEAECLLPVAYSYCGNRLLLDSGRGKNVQALRAAFLTLQDHLAASLTLDSPLVTLFELEGQQYHAVHRPLTLTDAILLVAPVERASGPTALLWMDNLLALFLTIFGSAQAFTDPALRPRIDSLFDLYFGAIARRDCAVENWDTLTLADVSHTLLMEVRESLCRLEGMSVSGPLNRRGACIALGSCLVFAGVLLHSQLPATLLRHTIAILRVFGLLSPTERLSLTLWLPLLGLEDNGRPVYLAVRVCEQAVLCGVVSGWNVSLHAPCDGYFLELLEESLQLLVRNDSFRRLVASLRAEPNQPMSPAPVAATKPRRTLASRLSRRRPQSPRTMSPAHTPDSTASLAHEAVLFFMACDPGAGVIVLPKLGEQDFITLSAFRNACHTIRKTLRGAQKRTNPRALLNHEFPLSQVHECGVLLPASVGPSLYWVLGRLHICDTAPVELYACFRDGTAPHLIELAFRHFFGIYF